MAAELRNDLTRSAGFVVSLLLGALGGWAASALGMPMPWLLGAMAANAIWVVFFPSALNTPAAFPESLRRAFVVVIAVLIGSTFTPELLSAFGGWWPSFVAVIVYTLVCQLVAYSILRRVNGLDKPTAYYSSLPGGLIESVTLGEQAGGNPQTIALLHFVRLTLVICIVPFGFSIWAGQAVGSAAGASFGNASASLSLTDIAVLIGSGLIGFSLGRLLRLPAGIVVGPILVSGAAHIFGLVQGDPPVWLTMLAQLFVGTGLGVRFAGIDRQMIGKAFSYCLVSVSMMLLIAIAFAQLLSLLLDVAPELYLLGFAPAGVIEMSLIALTLEASPVFVTAHHVVRVLATVLIIPMIYRIWLDDKRA